MLDRMALKLVRPAVEAAASRLSARGLTADQATLTGFGFGMLAAVMIASGLTTAAILPLLVNRALDGIDGALARRVGATGRGAFLDIALDFVFYAAIPLAFAVRAPEENALAAAVLIAAFVATGTSFLAFAVIAEKRGLRSTEYPAALRGDCHRLRSALRGDGADAPHRRLDDVRLKKFRQGSENSCM